VRGNTCPLSKKRGGIMRTGRIAIMLATFAFAIVAAFQFATVFGTTQAAHAAQVSVADSGPNSGLPYN
jgi:hypothetical protein